ncbi:MAG: fimbrillin family protein [Prevotella sp.]
MKRLIYILICLALMACSDDLYTPSDSPAVGQAMRFEAVVIDQPQTRGKVLDVNDNDVTRDFKAGDSFGLFIIDGNDEFVSLIDGKNAKNIRLTTPDGKAWNINSDIKEVVHKLGYRYVAYYPYSSEFDNCSSTADIQALLTAPAADQSSQTAIDWMFTEVTPPQTNAVTTLVFKHRYAKIDIYHSFTQEHHGNWTSLYPYTKTVDENNVEHYRYILDATSPQPLSVKGKYTIGNYLTGIKEMSYNCDNIAIENGRHAIVYTYGMDERCAVDLGLPSGIRWSPINLGAEIATYMEDDELAEVAANKLGRRLAWGELYEKDSYSYDTYIDPYQSGTSLLPTDISGTVYDPVTQYWGGHWSLPNTDDIQEFIDNTEIVSTETIRNSEIGKDIIRLTIRSKINGKEITMLTNGIVNNSSISNNQFMHYLSAIRSGNNNCYYLNYNQSLKCATYFRYIGYSIRPVLKELYTYSDADKKDIILRHIDELAVDLGITKTVTVDGEEVTYKLLWSPFNYGVESKVNLETYNGAPIDEDYYFGKCQKNLGMRLAWGDLAERTEFNTKDYADSEIAMKYNYDNSTSTNLDTRDLKSEDDIVQQNWPSGWSIPTANDFDLLSKNITVTNEQIDGHTWFRLTSKINGNYILIPGTGYIDDKENIEKWDSSTYLQSSTIGTGSSSVKGTTNLKRTIYALQISGTSAKPVSTAGRPTGLMIRPVKYVRVN